MTSAHPEPSRQTKDAQSRRLERLVRPCRCGFQKDGDWGYILYEWVGAPTYWRRALRNRSKLSTLEKFAKKYKHVLISCGGCGADVVREYGPNHRLQRAGPMNAPIASPDALAGFSARNGWASHQ